MPLGSPSMELHNHVTQSQVRYKSYEVFSFGENIKDEIFDKFTP